MGTFGYPADASAQSLIHAPEELTPTAPACPERGSSASSLSVSHDKGTGWEAPAVTVLAVRDAV